MLILARLLVERGSLRDRSEDWGAFNFLSMPSPGDRITVDHEGETNYLTVICVHHGPVPADEGTNETPSAHIVAKWTGTA